MREKFFQFSRSPREIALSKLDVFFGVAAGFLAVATLGVVFPGMSYLLDFLSNFKVALSLLALLVCCYSIFLRRSSTIGLLCALLLFLNCKSLIGFFSPITKVQPGDVCSEVSLSHFNLSKPKSFGEILSDKGEYFIDYPLIKSLVEKSGPDLVVFTSLKPQAVQPLSEILSGWSHRELHPSRGEFGLGIFSRIPFKNTEVSKVTIFGHPVLQANLDSEASADLKVLVANSPDPTERAGSRTQAELFSAISNLVRQSDSPVVTIGNFKSSPWSAAFKELRTFTGLINAAAGKFSPPTWPAGEVGILNRFFLGQVFDHTLYTYPLVLREHHVHSSIGSANLPIHSSFVLPCEASSF